MPSPKKLFRHCEEGFTRRSNLIYDLKTTNFIEDCFAPLAMTEQGGFLRQILVKADCVIANREASSLDGSV